MAIFIDAETLTDLSSFDGLIRAVGRWLNRNDLIDDAPDFIRLAEARLRRLLVMPEMEKQITLTAAASVPLPVDFDSGRLLYISSPCRHVIDPVSPDELYSRPSHGHMPTVYAIVAGAIMLSPTPNASYPAVLTYRASLPSLGPSQQSNWLLEKHSDIYLYATLVQAEFFGWNDDRLPLIKSALDEAIAECNESGNRKRYSGAPLMMRSGVREASRGAYRR